VHSIVFAYAQPVMFVIPEGNPLLFFVLARQQREMPFLRLQAHPFVVIPQRSGGI
jgi:hypothetical protein